MQIKPLLLGLLIPIAAVAAEPFQRFFLEGDGRIHLTDLKNGETGIIQYREADGSYSKEALRQINRLFRVLQGSGNSMSLRLIAILDLIEDHFRAEKVEVVSGFRTRQQNQRLRRRRRPAARTSLHLEGMAADVKFVGPPPEEVWRYLRGLNCCGAGYYNGQSVHVDIGPPRFWDERTAKIDQDPGAENRLVIARTDQDRYRSGETVTVQLARITHYPIGIAADFELHAGNRKVGQFSLEEDGPCRLIRNPREREFSWTIPEGFYTFGKVRLNFTVCRKNFPHMPDRIESNPIRIQKES